LWAAILWQSYHKSFEIIYAKLLWIMLASLITANIFPYIRPWNVYTKSIISWINLSCWVIGWKLCLRTRSIWLWPLTLKSTGVIYWPRPWHLGSLKVKGLWVVEILIRKRLTSWSQEFIEINLWPKTMHLWSFKVKDSWIVQ
jgi:hypothetical protein